ncbi:hypothetical protein Tco_1199955 [Tanacetum coccineum]
MSSSTVTYTSIFSDYEEPSDASSPRVVVYGYDGLPIHPIDPYVEAALQAPEQAPPSPDYVPGPEHSPSPDYVPEPEYPEYLVPSGAESPMEDQPLPDDASPAALSPGYIADFDSEEDPKEDSEEDPADYPIDGGDDDDESSDDDDDDDDGVEEDEEEEEEHLASADSYIVPAIDPVPSAKDTEAFETDESAPTPYASAPTPPSPPPSPLSSLSSPLPQIPSPPLPPTTSPIYAEAPLGYKAVGIRLRATSPPIIDTITTPVATIYYT